MAQTSQTFKKALSLALVMVFSAATSLPEFAESSGESKSNGPSAKSEMTSSENPLDSGKDILDYLFWTRDTKDELPDAVSNSAETVSYNTFMKMEANHTNQSIQSILKEKYQAFRNWIATWWQGERNYRNGILSKEESDHFLTPNADITAHSLHI